MIRQTRVFHGDIVTQNGSLFDFFYTKNETTATMIDVKVYPVQDGVIEPQYNLDIIEKTSILITGSNLLKFV